MRRRKLVGIILGLLLIAGLAVSGCGRTEKDNDKIVIGLTVPSLTHPFFIYLRDNVMDEAKSLGVEIVAADAEDAAARQMSTVEDFIARGVDGVLMSPVGADALVPAVEQLNQAGIPVATVDRQVSGGQVLVHVGADNVQGGRVAAQYVLKQLGNKGQVIELEGTPGASPAIDRKQGFHEILGDSNVQVIASQTANFQRSSGQSVMENLLQVHKDFGAVYAANDEMMLGAIEAMEANGLSPTDIVTVGYDAIPDAIQYIREGRLDATIEQYPGKQARMALRLLVQQIRDGVAPEDSAIYIQPVVITAENLEEAEDKGDMSGE